jgi:hypothetical protein
MRPSCVPTSGKGQKYRVEIPLEGVTRKMKSTLRLLLCALLSTSIGCQKRSQKYTLVTDRPWSVGEARTCSLDGKWKEGHCFAPENLASVQKYKYLVNTDFDSPVHFDAQQWAGLKGDMVCRLDSFEHATCTVQREEK